MTSCPDCGRRQFNYDAETVTCKNGHRHPRPDAPPSSAALAAGPSRVPWPLVVAVSGTCGALASLVIGVLT
jgi:4-hydroxy-3-methylbut-2-en-1-yl diphosphate synthase IspG/GcpE